MADQQDSRIDANSSSPRQTWSEQQLAITDADRAADLAAQRAGEAAFNAAKSRPSTKTVSNQVDAGDFGIPFTVTPAPAQPKGRSTRKGK